MTREGGDETSDSADKSSSEIPLKYVVAGVLGVVIVFLVIGLFLWAPWEETSSESISVCTEGQEKTYACPDGTVIVTHRCVGGRWVSTGETCPLPEFTITNCYTNIYEHWFWGDYMADVYATIKNNGDNKQPNSIQVTIRAIYDDGTYSEASTTYTHSVAPGETFTTNRVTINVIDSKTVGHDLDFEVIVFWQGESWSKTFYP